MPRSIRHIPVHERSAVLRLFIYGLLISASYTATKTVADSLFLSRVGSDRLAQVFVLSAVATGIITSVWFLLTKKLRLGLSLRISGVALSSATILAWAILPEFHHAMWLMASIYLLAKIKCCLNAVNLISAMNEILCGHSSRHAWAVVGLGAPVAGILVGSLIGIEATAMSLGTWLLFAAVLDLIAVVPFVPSQRHRVPEPAAPMPVVDREGKTRAKARSALASNRFRWCIGALVAAKVIVLTFVTFQWNVSAGLYFGGDEQALARYFGIFYACVGGATLLVQAVVTGQLLTRYGVAIPLMSMPLALLVLNSLYAVGAGLLFLLIVATLAKSMVFWRRSVYETTLHMLYTNIDRDQRRRAIAVNSSFVKPLSEAAASLVLLAGTAMVHQTAAVVATLIWAAAAYGLLRLVVLSSKTITHDTPAPASATGSEMVTNPTKAVASVPGWTEKAAPACDAG